MATETEHYDDGAPVPTWSIVATGVFAGIAAGVGTYAVAPAAVPAVLCLVAAAVVGALEHRTADE